MTLMTSITRATALLVAVWSLSPAASASHVPRAATRFDVNDVSFLWPVPRSAADAQQLLSASEAGADTGTAIWPRAAFETLLQNARATKLADAAGRERGIRFSQFDASFSQPQTWKVAAFRFDPSAPGGHSGAIAEFGSTPQLRVILQPVTVDGATVTVHDVTAHLAFSFKSGDGPPGPGGFPRAIPDDPTVRGILEELKRLKDKAGEAGVVTDGELRVHPALAANIPGYKEQVKAFLKNRMRADRLTEMAFMGLQPPEPWIFFGMRKNPTTGEFERSRPPAIGRAEAQMLTFRGGSHVVPTPTPRNLPGGGVSTHVLFSSFPPPQAVSPVPPNGPAREEIPDVIANPQISHVLNTDCISCHTESALRKTLNLPASSRFAFQRPAGISGVSPDVLPSDEWNVRNFGWFPSFSRKTVVATATMRTANESAEAAAFINERYFSGKEPNGNMNGNDHQTSPAAEPVASPLTLVMDIKDRSSFAKLKGMIEHMQSKGENSEIVQALNKIGTVHFARFVFLNEAQLAVITTYDGAFDRYIDAFVDDIGDIFDAILAHVKDWPPGKSVRERRQEFLEFVRKHDLKGIPPFYSAYPKLKVGDILQMQRELEKRRQ